MSPDNSEFVAAPFFSIIMPCFNSEEYLDGSIRSILDQTEKDLELIVVDDGSTDSSQTIIQSFADKDSRVKFLKNDHNSGASGARNCGVYHSEGEWICFLDSDDLFLGHCLRNRKSIIRDNPDIRFFSSDFMRWIDNGSKNIRQSEKNDHWKACFSRCEDNAVVRIADPLNLFLERVVAWTGGVTLNRKIFIEIGGFNETLRRAEDHHLWFRCAALSGSLCLIKSADSIYRIRDTGLSGGIDRLTSYNLLMYRIMKKDPLFFDVESEIDKKIDHYRYMLSVEARHDGKRCRAIRYAFDYWLKRPFHKKGIRNFLGALLFRS